MAEKINTLKRFDRRQQRPTYAAGRLPSGKVAFFNNLRAPLGRFNPTR